MRRRISGGCQASLTSVPRQPRLPMTDTTILPFPFPAVGRKKHTADFYGCRLASDGGIMLLAMAERRPGIEAACFTP